MDSWQEWAIEIAKVGCIIFIMAALIIICF